MNRARLFVSACVGMFLFGVALVLQGTLFGLPAMRARLELSTLVRQGDLQTLLLFGVLVSTILVGPLMDRFGHKLVLSLSAALVAVSLAGFAFANGYQAAQILSFVLGVGGGGLNMATNVMVSDIYGEDRGAKLNQLGVFFGVGALFLPFVTAWVARSITQLILLSALLSAACAVAYIVLKFPDAREASGASIFESLKAVRSPGVLLFGFLLFFESGNESAMTGWTSTWATNLGAGVRTATLMLALLQGMMMIGRLLAAPVLRVVSKTQLVLASAIGGFLSVAILLAAKSVPMLALGAGLAGLTFAAIYPTVLALAGDRYQRYAATVFGILFTIGISGGMFYPWAIGHISQSLGLRAGMFMPLVGTAAITVIMLMLRAKHPPPPEQSL
jgi:MFS transporter, FHS family, glucose/mannose:H+ symporter